MVHGLMWYWYIVFPVLAAAGCACIGAFLALLTIGDRLPNESPSSYFAEGALGGALFGLIPGVLASILMATGA